MNLRLIPAVLADATPEPVTTPPLFVRRSGAGPSGVLFVHGFGEGGFVWRGVAPHVARDRRTLLPDLRGHGNSTWSPDGRYSLRGHVRDLVALLAEERLERYVLVGHSMGGAVCLALAALAASGARPEALAGLVLVDYGPQSLAHGSSQVRFDFQAAAGGYPSCGAYLETLREARPLTDVSTLRMIARSALRGRPGGGLELKRDPRLLDPDAAPLFPVDEAWSALRQVKAPILVLRGVASAILSADTAQRIAVEARDARIFTIARSGHNVMGDNPQAFSKAASAFVDNVLS